MFIEFSVGNHRSFGEVQSLSLMAANMSSQDKALDEGSIFTAPKGLSLLKCAALYGANASGKSNLVEAMRFMRSMVLNSSKDTQSGEAIDVEEFRLSTPLKGQPSHFEMVFAIEGRQYRYGFDVTPERVVAEWLFETRTTKEARLFVREGDDVRFTPSTYREGQGLPERTRNNALFLSVAAQFNGAIALKIVAWFRSLAILSGLEDRDSRLFTLQRMENEAHRQQIVDFIKKLDVGIADIQVERSAQLQLPLFSNPEPDEEPLFQTSTALANLAKARPRVTVTTSHARYDELGHLDGYESFDMARHESAGTQKLFALTGRVMSTLRGGRVLVVDELDARLHPLLTKALVRLFNSNDGNPLGAQLLFATHDTNLLDRRLLRRDQIWFAEKDDGGATHLYSLVEIETPNGKVRNDASFEADYIRGRYGAIPFLGDLSSTLHLPSASQPDGDGAEAIHSVENGSSHDAA